ncbi:MAG: AMP-binding protein [Saprospiraceae bacterium]|nr:AMP-binding protein [Saprospiraceae bacterium]
MESRPWLKNYPAGIPANVNTEVFTSLKDFVDVNLEKFAPLKAFTLMGKSMTYSQLNHQSAAFAAYLQYRGLKPGDRIALMMPNLLQYPIAIIGALRAGLIIVNVNPLYTPRELEFILADSEVKAIVLAENFAHNLEKVLGKTKIEVLILTSIGEMLGTFKGALVDFTIRYFKRMVPKFNLANTVSFTTAIRQGSHQALRSVQTQANDLVMLQYTGGTTGISKAAMLSHANVLANIEQIKAVICYYLKEREETTLSPLPMYHIFAFAVNIMAMLSIGANTVLVINPRDIDSVVKAFQSAPISLMTGVNTLYNAMLHHAEFLKSDFKALKVTVAGGMALQSSVADKWKAITGCYLTEGYGLTEASPVVSLNPIDGKGKNGSVGLPVPSTDVRIVDESGRICGPGEAGEIIVKGPQIMMGYFKRQDETDKTVKDGWLYTGDIGYMDADGFFFVVDRKKDMINVSGFNVYPNEIEEVIARHPKVLEVAVIGIPDERCGEAVKAFVVKRESNLSESELKIYCKENLTGYKLPKFYEFRDTLPKTNVGKILRRELRSS